MRLSGMWLLNIIIHIREELKKDDPTVEKELELYLDEQKSVFTRYYCKMEKY